MGRPSYQQVLTENHKLREEVAALQRENAALQKQVTDLQKALETAQRQAQRQAAPFSKGQPKEQPRKPGRKPGRRYGRKAHRNPPPPDQIDERHEVPLPECCAHCGSDDLQETHVASQYQMDLPRRPIYRQFDIHFGVCRNCGRTVHGRHELQTSDAFGAAASQLGPAVHAAMAVLNKELGLSHGKVKRCLEMLFGISISRASSAHSVLRTSRRCEEAYGQVAAAVRASPQVTPDETGWRVAGRSAWLHVLAGNGATYYEVAPKRDAEVAEQVLGPDWSGVLIHDGWSPYDGLSRARHQQCLDHLRRRCERILQSARGGAARFPRQVLELLQAAFAMRDAYRRGEFKLDQVVRGGLGLACRLEQLVAGRFTYEPNRRLAKHLKKHLWEWFWFLLEPGIEATNWQAEQALRPGVVNRKVWGGNRSWNGARAQSVLTSILRTCAQRGHDAFEYLIRVVSSPEPVPLPTATR